jgi:hypothetical protein
LDRHLLVLIIFFYCAAAVQSIPSMGNIMAASTKVEVSHSLLVLWRFFSVSFHATVSGARVGEDFVEVFLFVFWFSLVWFSFVLFSFCFSFLYKKCF